MTTIERTYTLDEFMALPDAGKRYELINGRLVEMPGPSYAHGAIIDDLYFPLRVHVAQAKSGRLLTNTAYAYDPARRNHAPVPDLAFVATAKLALIVDQDTALPFAPDLAVEVVSPSDKWYEVQHKIADYVRFGVRLVWLISPPEKAVYIYRNDDTQMRVVSGGADLDGEDVVPGFSMKVSALFETK